MSDLRIAAQQALEALKTGGWNMTTRAIADLERALAQQDEPVEDVLLSAAGLALDALEHDRQAAARTGRSISMLSLRAIEELRGVFRDVLARQDEPVDADAAYQRWLEDTHAPALRRMDSQGAFAAGWQAALTQQAEPDHETRAELAEQQVVQLAEERDHYRNLWQKAQQAEPVEQLAELQAMLRAEVDRLIAAGIQPQRKLVPLTEEKKRALADKFLSCQPESYEVSGVFDLISAVERAHGIKE